jgi:mono/diheme cytochrome c family protein
LKKLIFAGLIVVLGCRHLPPSKPRSEFTPQEQAGRRVFVRHCSACHYADSEAGLNGPGLEGLFRKRYLPSGMVANDERVTAVIVRGRNMMPGVGDTLSDQQMAELLAYLHTL